MSELKIVYLSESEIKPATYNPRNITDKERAGLKKSIETFGMVDPLIVNKRNSVLVGGHQRLNACKELGMTSFPCVFVDLDEAKEKALNLALNSQEISGKYDKNLLGDLIKDIDAGMGADFLKGFNIDDTLKSIGQSILTPEEKKAKEEHDAQKEAKARTFTLKVSFEDELFMNDLREELELREFKVKIKEPPKAKKKKG